MHKANATRVDREKVKVDPITTSLMKLVNEIEDKYKLDKEIKTTKGVTGQLKTLPIATVHEYIASTVPLIPAGVRRSRNIEVSGVMGSVLYLSHLMGFRDLVRVDFREHPGITMLVGLLGKFIHYSTCSYEKTECINAILESLEMYESISLLRINVKLPYKLLRVFYLMVVYDNLIDASIIAELILGQINLAMGHLPNNSRDFGNRRKDRRTFSGFDESELDRKAKQSDDGFDDSVQEKPVMTSRMGTDDELGEVAKDNIKTHKQRVIKDGNIRTHSKTQPSDKTSKTKAKVKTKTSDSDGFDDTTDYSSNDDGFGTSSKTFKKVNDTSSNRSVSSKGVTDSTNRNKNGVRPDMGKSSRSLDRLKENPNIVNQTSQIKTRTRLDRFKEPANNIQDSEKSIMKKVDNLKGLEGYPSKSSEIKRKDGNSNRSIKGMSAFQ